MLRPHCSVSTRFVAVAPGAQGGHTTVLLLLRTRRASWTVGGLDEAPALSLLRGCSAPVRLAVQGESNQQLGLLARCDTDSYARRVSFTLRWHS
jgi:hypothetical protein